MKYQIYILGHRISLWSIPSHPDTFHHTSQLGSTLMWKNTAGMSPYNSLSLHPLNFTSNLKLALAAPVCKDTSFFSAVLMEVDWFLLLQPTSFSYMYVRGEHNSTVTIIKS